MQLLPVPTPLSAQRQASHFHGGSHDSRQEPAYASTPGALPTAGPDEWVVSGSGTSSPPAVVLGTDKGSDTPTNATSTRLDTIPSTYQEAALLRFFIENLAKWVGELHPTPVVANAQTV